MTGSRALRWGTRARRRPRVVAIAISAVVIQAIQAIIIPPSAAARRRRRPQEVRVRRIRVGVGVGSRVGIGTGAREEALDVLWRALPVLRVRGVVLPAAAVILCDRRAAAQRRRAGRRRRRMRRRRSSTAAAAAVTTTRPIPIRIWIRVRERIGIPEPLLDLGELRGRRVARREARVRVRVRRREAVLAHMRGHVRRPRRHQVPLALALALAVYGAARGGGREPRPRPRDRARATERAASVRELVGARARVRALEETALVAELFDRPCDHLRAMLRTDRERGRGEKLMNGDIRKKEARKQEISHQGRFHVIYPIMCSASYCQFVISPSPSPCQDRGRVVDVAVMRSNKQTRVE